MPDSLSPATVAAWMRSQAARFNEMADEIEATFNMNGRPPSVGRTPSGTTTDRVRQLLSDGKARRPATIANELGLKETSVIGVVTQPNSGLVRNERGWVTLSDNMAHHSGSQLEGGAS